MTGVDAAAVRGPDASEPLAVTVVLPSYNEKENITFLIDALRQGFREAGIEYEIIVMDDQSPDGTADLVSATFEDDPGVTAVTRTETPGLAYSIREGLERATKPVILVMDADFNHMPADGVRMAKIAPHVDLVVGSRFIFGGGMPNRFRYMLSFLYNLMLRYVLGTRLDENLSGLFTIRRDCLKNLDFDKIFWGYGDYFFRLLLLSQRANLVHIQYPVRYGSRLGGASKTRFLEIFMRYSREVVWILWMKVQGKW